MPSLLVPISTLALQLLKQYPTLSFKEGVVNLVHSSEDSFHGQWAPLQKHHARRVRWSQTVSQQSRVIAPEKKAWGPDIDPKVNLCDQVDIIKLDPRKQFTLGKGDLEKENKLKKKTQWRMWTWAVSWLHRKPRITDYVTAWVPLQSARQQQTCMRRGLFLGEAVSSRPRPVLWETRPREL